MKKTANEIAAGKKADIIFQCIMFVIMAIAILYNEKSIGSFLFMFIMGVAQLLSSIIWLLALAGKKVPMTTVGLITRVAIIVVFLVLIGLGFCVPECLITALCLLIIIGPIIGISYFVITCMEYSTNAKAGKSDQIQ